MYIVTVHSQLITREWISAKSGKMELDIAKAVMDRMINRLCQQLWNKEIKDYRVEITNAE